jgi:hypothetical protein|tara:strand:+ start:383 stop:1054 length:672 start_codon:yes stop_codon:yes gene_type:complete
LKKNVTISIDDLHPKKDWGCDGDLSVAFLKNLWKEFGCKFTLFIPSNYHGKYPLSKHKDWVDFWRNQEWVELAAHGHFHLCERDDIGECEFFELDTEVKAEERIQQCLNEWKSVGYTPKGWRNPGWLAHPQAIQIIGNHFKYSAIHNEHNHDIKWSCKTFTGHDGINQTESIQMYGDTFMFQSHIAGDWNDNIWNKNNYENFREVLIYLSSLYELNYVTLGEL